METNRAFKATTLRWECCSHLCNDSESHYLVVCFDLILALCTNPDLYSLGELVYQELDEMPMFMQSWIEQQVASLLPSKAVCRAVLFGNWQTMTIC